MAGEISLAEELRQREEQRQRQGRDGRPAEERPAGEWRAKTGAGAAAPGGNGEAPAAEVEVNTAAFGYYRGIGDRALFIEFQRLQGSWPAPGYAWLPCPVWQGGTIILAYATGLKVTIRGRNLRSAYERILRQQVFRVTEMGREADSFMPEAATVVYAIEVQEPEEDAGGGSAR